MAFKASDYPDITKASDVYNVTRSDFQKLERQLSETPTTSKNYKALVEQRNAAKEKMDKALKNYEELAKKRKEDFDKERKRKADAKKRQTLQAKLKDLNNNRQRTEDKGDSTSAIDAAINKAQADLDKLNKETKEKKVVTENRPASVPAGAKFNTVTGQWTLGNKNWDKSGKALNAVVSGTRIKPDDSQDDTGDNSGTAIESSFDPAKARIGEEKDRPGTVTTTTTGFNVAETDFDKVLAQAQSVFGGIDEIFKTNEDLRKLLIAAVGDPNVVGDEYTVTRFISELENTKWFKTNAGPIRQRGFYERQYNELSKGLKMDDPDYKNKLSELDRTSEYGRGLQDTVETVNEYVTQLLGIGALDDMTIRAIASDIYKYANEDDAVKIRNAVLGAARYGIGKVIGGQAGEALADLKAIAGANGFDLEKQFATDLPTWLDRINKGESPETYKKIIRDAAKTAFNVSDRVSALMDQGVNLDTIYSPYKNVMSSILEVNPQTVTLKDLSDKGVFGAKEEMSLFDFQKALRKDARWQYTQNAREEVSNSVLGVLKDFGFQG
jgi:hypothetical protein